MVRQDNRACRDPGFKCRGLKQSVTTSASAERKPSFYCQSSPFPSCLPQQARVARDFTTRRIARLQRGRKAFACIFLYRTCKSRECPIFARRAPLAVEETDEGKVSAKSLGARNGIFSKCEFSSGKLFSRTSPSAQLPASDFTTA